VWIENLEMNIPKFAKLPDAIAVDLDGTLLNSHMQVSARNRGALQKCIERGIPVIIATSRSERAARRVIGDDLANACSLVMANGANARGRAPLSGLIREAIPSQIAKDIVELTLRTEPAVRITVEIDGFDFGCNLEVSPEELWELNSATPDMVKSIEEAIARIPTKISVKGFGRDLSELGQKIYQQFSSFVSVIPSDQYKFINVVNNSTSKLTALRALLGSHAISLNGVIAFGDDIPDLDLLQACGIPVAMANAFPEIKAVCVYHTASNDEDGVAIVLEQMFV
jgi:Cof subfamily protein (haloacid dehalogenase superfamily)